MELLTLYQNGHSAEVSWLDGMQARVQAQPPVSSNNLPDAQRLTDQTTVCAQFPLFLSRNTGWGVNKWNCFEVNFQIFPDGLKPRNHRSSSQLIPGSYCNQLEYLLEVLTGVLDQMMLNFCMALLKSCLFSLGTFCSTYCCNFHW